MCIELINNIAETDSQTASAFFQQFFIPILQDIFFVLTDADHKAGNVRTFFNTLAEVSNEVIGFKLQALLLSRMFYFVDSGKVQTPLYTPDQAPVGTSNSQFLREYVAGLLRNAFPHLQP